MYPLNSNNPKSSIANYEVLFTPKFPLPIGSNIRISFPSNMLILDYSINYGLEDINEDNPVGI